MSKIIRKIRKPKYKGWCRTELCVLISNISDSIYYICEKNKKLYIIGSDDKSSLGYSYIGYIPIKNYPNLLRRLEKGESLPKVKFIISKKQFMKKMKT